MLTVTKEFSWDSAHMLYDHNGLCKNVHGHTYKMHVELRHMCTTVVAGPSAGMVIDFSDLKELVHDVIISKVDHAFITSGESDAEAAIVRVLSDLGMKVYWLGSKPTAEAMAIRFAEILSEVILSKFAHLRLVSVTVWETPTSFAKYTL